MWNQPQSPSLAGTRSRTGSRLRFASSAPVPGRCPPHRDVDADAPLAGQPRNNRQNSERLRDVGTIEAGALSRPGRTEEEEKECSVGVSDPALALFGPLLAGSLTPTCPVSVVRQEAARLCARI